MNTIVIGNYNNYYNRLHKESFSTAQDYSQNGMDNTHVFDDINFNRADNVNTNLTINLNPLDTEFNDNINPDYLLVCTSASGHPVVSRWFILEALWNRDHQLLLTLRRDLVTDFFDAFKNDDFYCEKGAIPDNLDVLRYTSEGMTFNQILVKRTALKQYSNQSGRYIVGYVDRGWNGGTVYPSTIYKEFETFEELPFRKLNNLPFVDMTGIEYGIDVSIIKDSEPVFTEPITTSEGPFVSANTQFILHANLSNRSGGRRGAIDPGSSQVGSANISTTDSDLATLGASLASALTSESFNMLPTIESDLKSKFQIADDEMKIYDGKLIKVGSKVYSVTYTLSNTFKWFPVGSMDGSTAYRIWNALKKLQSDIWTTGNPLSSIQKVARAKYGTFSLSEVTGITIPQNRSHSGNLPYDIFVMNDDDTCRAFASNFATQYAGGNVVYDIQVLPFEPDTSGSVGNVTIATGHQLRWATKDSLSGYFKHESIVTYSGNSRYKVGSNLHSCRIYSPDGASCWEFNPAKIGGVSADSIRYEVTFAPIRPYMHIFPTFGGIYGSVNKGTSETATAESRGLICTGDYSIPYSTNNWSTYQLQNSAYQLSHDRMIQNMSVQHDAERVQEIVGGIANNVGSSFSGAQSGAMMGGPTGAIVGGIVGGVLSAGAGIAQYATNERLRAEEMSYAEDMFGYALQSIRAQAQPLAHSNYLTVGVAYFPYIELYESTLDEEEIFLDRLRVNGWTIGVVTSLDSMKDACTASSAPTNFCKGRLVRYGGEEDSHLVNELNIELQRGVRFE